MDMEFEKYKALLEAIMPVLEAHFSMQGEYVKCCIGCSHCCQKGYYPVTKAEAKLMRAGFQALPSSLREEISKKAGKIAAERDLFVKEGNDIIKFKYACPLLIEDKCSIYEYRPIICRTQGLIMQSAIDENSFNMPACVYTGLNYANVWDEKLNCFSEEKIKGLNLKEPPVALDFSYESLLEVCGINPDTLPDNLKDPDNSEIRMIFEWVTPETAQESVQEFFR